jgi:isocitrate dehydrogenase kinase/phosphatase
LEIFADVIIVVDNEILIMAAFLGSGLLAYVIIPGLLVVWDRVLDHMESTGEQKK